MKLNKRVHRPALFAALLAIPIGLASTTTTAAPGDVHRGTVVSVIDAQTIRVARKGGGEMRIRLPQSDSVALLRDHLQGRTVAVREDTWNQGLMHGEVIQTSRSAITP